MMNIIQAAAQAVETGKSGISIFLDAGVIGLIITNIGLLIKGGMDRKTIKQALELRQIKEDDKDNEATEYGPNPRAGESEICREHGEAIAKLTESEGNMKDSLKRIEYKVDRILERK